jgi:chitinase
MLTPLRNYDVWGSSSNPGPNAPLGNLCGTSSQPQASAQAALKQWTDAGFPKSKLLLGLATYGYVSKSTRTGLTGSLVENAEGAESGAEDQPLNDLGGAHDRSWERDQASKRIPVPEETPDVPEGGDDDKRKAAAGDLSQYFGQQIAFNQIVALGATKKSGNVYVEANGYLHAWDNCSDTPVSHSFSVWFSVDLGHGI